MTTTQKHPRKAKKLIVCCDGTWMNSDIGWVDGGLFGKGHPQQPSNVTRLVRSLEPEDSDGRSQIGFYQSGVGTGWSFADKWFGGGLAFGLSEHIREAYGFLVNNYVEASKGEKEESDSIYLIGFSRGAFTARSVAGMVGCLGLLEKKAMQYFYAIFEDFEKAGEASHKPKLPVALPGFNITAEPGDLGAYLKDYKAQLVSHKLTRDVKIAAVCVWDTVGSLGLPIQPWLQRLGFPTTLHSYRFYDTEIADHVENAFQVLALDEHRSAFSPAVWSKDDKCETNLKQIWFPGVHTTAGGGAEDSAMPDLSLAWMMDQLSPFLEFNKDYLIEQVTMSRKVYEAKHREWQWGLGDLANSLVFPTNLGGAIDRTPRSYHRTEYSTGKLMPDLLKNTNEMIHASVRARYLLNGKTYDGKPYTSAALEGWELKDKNSAGKPVYWECKTAEKDGSKKRLEEDTRGDYEKLILDMDHEVKDRLFSSKEFLGTS